ncbi:MAG: TonB family protein [Saprospiraceae bacterium]|nr:TonB family protein [Saprospiraceae bacterium]
MNKFKLLAILFLSAIFPAHAQQRYKDYYWDQLGEGEKMLSADYQSISIRTAEGDYVQKIFYPEKKILTHYLTCKDSRFYVKEGPCQEWYDNGKLWKEGAYKNNQAHGVWTFYDYDNGSKSEYGAFEKGIRSGRWTFLDSLGRTTMEQFFKDGKLHGECKIYNTQGQLAMVQQFKEGKKVSEQRLLDDPDVYGSVKEALEIHPHLKGCENDNAEQREVCTQRKFSESLYQEIRYPEDAREEGVTGQVFIRFSVEKDGSVSGITTLRGVCASIEKECLRVMKFMPAWMPGINNGKPVRVLYTLPIRFTLE